MSAEIREPRLSGIVVDPRGTPIRRSRVSLLLVDGAYPEARTFTGDDGVFSFDTRTWPRGAAEIVATADGYRSVSEPLVIYPGMERDDLDLRLQDGFELNGLVRWRGEPCRASVCLDLAPCERGLTASEYQLGSPLCRDGGEIDTKQIGGLTDARGRFVIRGLRAATYGFQVEPEVEDVVFVPDFHSLELRLPREALVLNLPHLRQTISLRDRRGKKIIGALVVKARREFSDLSSHQMSSISKWRRELLKLVGRGEFTMALLPGEIYDVHAAGLGYQPQIFEIQAPDVESSEPMVLTLDDWPDRCLRLFWRGATARGVKAVRFDLESPSDQPGLNLTRNAAFKLFSEEFLLRPVPGQEDHFVLRGLTFPPGRYQVRFQPELEPVGDPDRNLRFVSLAMIKPFSTVAMLVVPPEGDAVLELELQDPAFVELISDAADGTAPWGDWAILRDDGITLNHGAFDLNWGFGIQTKTVTIGPLEPGHRTLRLDIEGRDPELRRIQLLPAETRVLEIVGTSPARSDDHRISSARRELNAALRAVEEQSMR